MRNHVLLVFSSENTKAAFEKSGLIIADDVFPSRGIYEYRTGGVIRCVTLTSLEAARRLAGLEFTCVVNVTGDVPPEIIEYLSALVRGIPE